LVCDFKLNNPLARAAVFLCLLAGCGCLLLFVAFHFVTRSLTDLRVPANREALELAAAYFPGSPRINARLGEAELNLVEDREAALAQADSHLARAIIESPFEYNFRLLQASVREARGDRAGAEQSLRTAVALAPGHTDTHWRLANLLVRAGKADQAIEEFRIATASRPLLLPGAFELVWNVSRGSVEKVSALVGKEALPQLALAHFLLRKSKADEAVSLFSRTEPKARLASPDAATLSAAFISALIEAGRGGVAQKIWLETLGFNSDEWHLLLCDGSFEDEIPAWFDQFAWHLGRSEYARIGVSQSDDVATREARTGNKSLRIDFAGRDTTKLSGEITHLIPVEPGAQYHLECYARTQKLETPEGPRVAVLNGSESVAESAPVAAGSHDWQRVEFDFTAPVNARSLQVSIRRIPKFSYDDPSRGTVWFDDFKVYPRGGAGGGKTR